LSDGFSGFGPAFRFLLRVERRFRRDDALMMAAGLSYTTLLSLVPVLTIVLAVLAIFPAFEAVRGQMQMTLVGMLAPEVAAQVNQSIAELMKNAGNLTVIGSLTLVVTSLLLLVTIEDALNRIFRVSASRSPMSRVLVYWTVVTLGPILLAASLSLGDWLLAVGQHGDEAGEVSQWVSVLAVLVRFLTTVALFTLLFCAVPNRHVPLRYAFYGGILTALAVAALRFGFHIYIADFHAYQSVYGALATIPILMFWMYLVWVAVLAGAEFTVCLFVQEVD